MEMGSSNRTAIARCGRHAECNAALGPGSLPRGKHRSAAFPPPSQPPSHRRPAPPAHLPRKALDTARPAWQRPTENWKCSVGWRGGGGCGGGWLGKHSGQQPAAWCAANHTPAQHARARAQAPPPPPPPLTCGENSGMREMAARAKSCKGWFRGGGVSTRKGEHALHSAPATAHVPHACTPLQPARAAPFLPAATPPTARRLCWRTPTPGDGRNHRERWHGETHTPPGVCRGAGVRQAGKASKLPSSVWQTYLPTLPSCVPTRQPTRLPLPPTRLPPPHTELARFCELNSCSCARASWPMPSISAGAAMPSLLRPHSVLERAWRGGGKGGGAQ